MKDGDRVLYGANLKSAGGTYGVGILHDLDILGNPPPEGMVWIEMDPDVYIAIPKKALMKVVKGE